MSSLELRRVEVSSVLPLRHAILRPNRPKEAAQFEGDDDSLTQHWAALEDTEVVACLSLMPAPWQSIPAFQLRGMAVAAERQGQGLGARLLSASLASLESQLVWCNARICAVSFYERAGFEVVSEIFDVPDVGPHRRMLRQP